MDTTRLELNPVKSNLSLTYIKALAAKLDYAYQEASRDFDMVGIDCSIANKKVGIKNGDQSAGDVVNIQVKSFSRTSTKMYRESDKDLEYKLTSEIRPISINFYLVIVEIPEEKDIEKWIEVNPEELIIRRRAYYLKVTEKLDPGFVKISKSNLLDPKSLPGLFTSTDKKEELL